MNARENVLAFVLAGGEGSRLHPLTAERCKPAVPFNGKHRIVDFVLSNLVNSQIHSIYLLVQYKSQSLIEHVRSLPQPFVTVVPPQMRHGLAWFHGTADAVCQNLHLIETLQPDLVAVFGADHIYRMDVRQMIDFHVENDAHVTVATLPVQVSRCHQFGIVEVDDRHRIRQFREKPHGTESMPGRDGWALASMGNYIFNADVLHRELRHAHETGEDDFGRDVLPRIVRSHRLLAYDFHTNRVPGVLPHEEHGYWRDVGTIDAYYEAHFDTLGTTPKFRMTNRLWPIYASADPAESAWIDRDAVVERSIVMERSVIGRGAHLRRVIVDRDNVIPPGETIGLDLERDRRRFHVSESGIVVVPKGAFKDGSADTQTRATHDATLLG